MISKRLLNLTQLVLTICLILYSFAVISAQKQTISRPIADPWCHFSYSNTETLMAELDNIAIMLQSEPNKFLYLTVYRKKDGLPGANFQFFNRIRFYLVENRGIDKNRLIFLNGGVRYEMRYECWIDSSDSELRPKPTAEPDLPENQTFEFDSHYYAMPDDICAFEITCLEGEYHLMQLDEYAEILKKRKDVKAYLVAYAEYCPQCESHISYSKNGRKRIVYQHPDPSNTALQILLKEKNYLTNTHKIDSSRIVLINGGYREVRSVDLWTVPPNGDKPKLTPTTFPSKQKKKSKR